MPESCIYFLGVLFREIIFFRKKIAKITIFWAFQTIFFVLRDIGKNIKSPLFPKIRLILYIYHLLGHIRELKSSYFEFLAISILSHLGKN